MLSKDYPREFKQRFADRRAEGASITMPQHEFGLSKPTVKAWRERIEQEGVEVIDRPRKNNEYTRQMKLEIVEALLAGEGDYEELAFRFGARNSIQIREWVKRYLDGGEPALCGTHRAARGSWRKTRRRSSSNAPA